MLLSLLLPLRRKLVGIVDELLGLGTGRSVCRKQLFARRTQLCHAALTSDELEAGDRYMKMEYEPRRGPD